MSMIILYYSSYVNEIVNKKIAKNLHSYFDYITFLDLLLYIEKNINGVKFRF